MRHGKNFPSISDFSLPLFTFHSSPLPLFLPPSSFFLSPFFIPPCPRPPSPTSLPPPLRRPLPPSRKRTSFPSTSTPAARCSTDAAASTASSNAPPRFACASIADLGDQSNNHKKQNLPPAYPVTKHALGSIGFLRVFWLLAFLKIPANQSCHRFADIKPCLLSLL